jgi:hypothetical protein
MLGVVPSAALRVTSPICSAAGRQVQPPSSDPRLTGRRALQLDMSNFTIRTIVSPARFPSGSVMSVASAPRCSGVPPSGPGQVARWGQARELDGRT